MNFLCLSVTIAALTSQPAASQSGPAGEKDDLPMPRRDQTLIREKIPKQVWLGVTVSERTEGAGLFVDAVMPNSPAATAGIRKGDIIQKLGGQDLKSTEALMLIVLGSNPDTRIELELLRDGKTVTTEVLFKPRPGQHARPDARRRMNEAIETLRETGVEPPKGLIKPGQPALDQLREMAPEIQLDPFAESEPKPYLDSPPLQPLLKVEPEWQDGELHLKWNQPTEGKIDTGLEEEIKKVIRQQKERIDGSKAADDSPKTHSPEDHLWRRVQAAVASALENSGAAPEAREAAAKAIQKAREDWNQRELRRRELIDETQQVEREIRRLRERLEQLEKEAQEF